MGKNKIRLGVKTLSVGIKKNHIRLMRLFWDEIVIIPSVGGGLLADKEHSSKNIVDQVTNLHCLALLTFSNHVYT
ncbi:MAG: hypothetical protein R3B95_01785 [Nitrospirales bacterium]|nr:hypothetical protein [Nitrospirales bacterium]